MGKFERVKENSSILTGLAHVIIGQSCFLHIPDGFERVGNRISTTKNSFSVNSNQKHFMKKSCHCICHIDEE